MTEGVDPHVPLQDHAGCSDSTPLGLPGPSQSRETPHSLCVIGRQGTCNRRDAHANGI